MSQQEMERLKIILAVDQRQLHQTDAAQRLGLSTRQIKCLVQRYRQHGAVGLASKQHGKRPNNRFSTAVKQQAPQLLHQHYADFSPTFAHEKLTSVYGLRLSVDNLSA